MQKKTNILIFPAGSEIGIEIFHSLKYSHHINVFGASGKSDHAEFIYDENHYIENENLYINNEQFIHYFNELISNFKIEFIYPTHDDIANFLAKNQIHIKAKVITSSIQANHISRFKKETYYHFKNYDFCPIVYSHESKEIKFPVFLKPNDGQGGKESFVADNFNELNFYFSKYKNLIITEFLPGEELSVDCFTDFKGNLLFIGPRTRERIQMGISFRSTSFELTEEIKYIANTINNNLKLNGAWFFQIKKDSHYKYKLLELATRQSSTMGVYRHSGINFALLSFFNAQNIPVKILKNEYPIKLDRCLQNRYKTSLLYKYVYIDFDETIISNGKIHERVMAFLYQCKNNKIDLILITKHTHDLKKTLQEYSIATNLFKKIIHISEKENKWEYINPNDAIFIDNYWIDRYQVKEKLGIPVFDVDAIECLLK